jgi:anti-anti-sigma factor
METTAATMTEIGNALSVGVARSAERDHVRIVGELDMSSAGALEREISGIEDGAESGHLVVDLSDLRYVDSSGMDALLNIASSARRRRFTLEVTPGHAGLQRIFELTGLDRVLPFSDPLLK